MVEQEVRTKNSGWHEEKVQAITVITGEILHFSVLKLSSLYNIIILYNHNFVHDDIILNQLHTPL